MFGVLGAIAIKALLNMLASLVTEKFIKDMAVLLLDKLASRVESPVLKAIVADVEAAWKNIGEAPAAASSDEAKK